MTMTTWVPVQQYGETFYQCTVCMYGHTTQGISRSKSAALSYALEELAKLVRQSGTPSP